MIKEIVQKLELPKEQILFLHVKLKGLSTNSTYQNLTQQLLYDLNELYNPKTILVPTFTYSFTKNGIYDRCNSPSEVGRFSEEARLMYPGEKRTLNPVFNVIDTNDYLSRFQLDELNAFDKGSMFEQIHQEGHIIVSINIPDLIGTYLHFLEFLHKVPYRYPKDFEGEIINKTEKNDIRYGYYVRDLEADARWNRRKIIDLLEEKGARRSFALNGISFSWTDSKQFDKVLGTELNLDKNFLVTP